MAVVLVINGDRDMLDLYESLLQSQGHEPVTKPTIETGPETVRQGRRCVAGRSAGTR